MQGGGPWEDEDELLREQHAFLARGESPAARAVRVQRRTAPTPRETETSKSDTRADPDPREPPAPLLGAVVERCPDALTVSPPTAPPAPAASHPRGFPVAQHRSRQGVDLSSAPRGPRDSGHHPTSVSGGSGAPPAEGGEEDEWRRISEENARKVASMSAEEVAQAMEVRASWHRHSCGGGVRGCSCSDQAAATARRRYPRACRRPS